MTISALRRSLFLFIIFSLYTNSCAKLASQQPEDKTDISFYQGLQSKSDSGDVSQAVNFFDRAMGSSNIFIRQAAAHEIAELMSEGVDISSAVMDRVRAEASGRWAAAFEAAAEMDKEKILQVFFSMENGSALPNEIRRFILDKCSERENFFTENELSAINGHFSISRTRYNEALDSFRALRQEDKWPQRTPQLFLDYPILINDLGRAFQYTSSGTEGRDLFLQWENSLADSIVGEARFNLLFFAARIARRAGRTEQALSLFERSLAYAPDTVQSDACIWYILDTMARDATTQHGAFLEKLERYALSWRDGHYFFDIFERLMQVFISQREWGRIIEVFELIKDNGGIYTKAKYAWVIARLIEEGLLSNDEMRLAAKAANTAEASSEIYIRFAYDAGIRYESSALYYRYLGAHALQRPFLLFDPLPAASEESSPALEFIMGFFSNGAAEFALRYIRQMENDLPPDELRMAALALQQAELYAQSMRLVTVYINNEGYTPVRLDMELLYPRLFRTLIERHAKENGMEASLLFGLIRTESAFQSGIVSHAGAVGLTQLMPATGRETAGRIRRAGGPDYTAAEGGLDLTNPSVNVHIGAFYFNYLNERFENSMLSLFAYNAGMNRVRRWRSLSSYPDDLFLETVSIAETRDYGRKVLGAAAVYEEMYYRR
jgi:soluble lytic murein transglycosylase